MHETTRKRRFPLGAFLDRNRALFMLILLFLFLSASAPNFLSVDNITIILKGASLNAIVAAGFTIIFILGQLDLSIGAVVMLCGMLVIGLQPQLGWTVSILLSLAAGSVVGLVNGLLVVKTRINSFIVTLSTMTIVMGLMHLYSGGGSKSINEYRLADWLEAPALPFLPPMVIITLLLVLFFSFFLRKTSVGRGFYVVGGNPETAWLAGLNRDLYLICGFVLCSTLAAAGGILFAISLSSMTSYAVLGMRTLMTVLAAVIIGGALLTGGKGSVLKSYFAVLLLTTLFNGIGCFGLGFEVQIFVNGIILALVVLYEAFIIHRESLMKGRRPDLVKEAEELYSDDGLMEEKSMSGKDRTLAIVCVTLTAIVAIVAIFAMFFIVTRDKEPASFGVMDPVENQKEEDVFSLKGKDGQPLILEKQERKKIPPKPENGASFDVNDRRHWWNIEYAGWTVEKETMPPSPGDGPKGKKILLMKAGDHPYWTAYLNGFKKIAGHYGMNYKIFNGNWNIDLQAQQTDQAIQEKPDMIIFAPVDATACTPLLRRINRSGIPCITSNTIPCDEAMKYCLAWTGPDDWGQFRMLARRFADAAGKKGGYVIVRHMPGSSPFFARTYAPITELKEYAPDMKLLAMETANLEAEGTMQLISTWITKYGDELKGIILPGDGFSMTGALEAVKKSGRKNLIIVAAGNSKTGMDSVKAGEALAVTYQSSEGDGAIGVFSAAEWFEGKKIDPVRYLPKCIITKENVDDYMPAQW